ncbi:dethiobiotin synthase [Acidiphilium sp. PA]|uniref:dethiobiotin synthase n=1 Tax=Acidiphilium sp. PA TaxID=2871705 RepID=UPI002243ED19|nr:dethiobiotin synthase [Acidiphilium sp. PA]MCW8308482.1 dethiobiotin synthase [Acidiphilium sp. PA]
MTQFFITGTGTDIGKTHIAAAMLRHWHGQGIKAWALKPVASGYQPARSAASDAGTLLAAMGQMTSDTTVAKICPWRFPDPLSPDMAAARAGKTIPFDALLAFCRTEMSQSAAPLLIEGVGGAMVPLDDRHTVRDWMAELGLPAILVAGGYLGAISHTLCTIEALRACHIPIAMVILNPIGDLPVPPAKTMATLIRHGAGPVTIFDTPAWHDWLLTL